MFGPIAYLPCKHSDAGFDSPDLWHAWYNDGKDTGALYAC